MKKQLLYLFVLSFFTIAGHAQDEVYWQKRETLLKFSKSYFRSDPFTGEFSGFLKHLINDPDITGRIIQKKTDTSLYSLQGRYTTYNPFSFRPERVEILLQEIRAVYDDSLHIIDTIFTYQLMAYVKDDAAGKTAIEKEFEKINRPLKRKFQNRYEEIKDGNTVTAGIYNYFMPLHFVSPLSIAWGRLENQQERVLNITLRIKMDANKAELPTLVKPETIRRQIQAFLEERM